MKSSFRHFLVSWLPVIIWACCIFYVSSFRTAQVTSTQQQEFVVKKFAHIIEYAILASLTYRALRLNGVERTRAGLYAVAFVFLYGASDEFHESFVPGREPRIRDVFIDGLGGSIAIFVIWKLLPKAPQRLRLLAKKWELI